MVGRDAAEQLSVSVSVCLPRFRQLSLSISRTVCAVCFQKEDTWSRSSRSILGGLKTKMAQVERQTVRRKPAFDAYTATLCTARITPLTLRLCKSSLPTIHRLRETILSDSTVERQQSYYTGILIVAEEANIEVSIWKHLGYISNAFCFGSGLQFRSVHTKTPSSKFPTFWKLGARHTAMNLVHLFANQRTAYRKTLN